MKPMKWMGLALLLLAAPAWAQARLTPGTYAMQDGSYQVKVWLEGADLVTEDIYKKTTYAPAGEGEWRYSSDVTGATYAISVVDADTLQASKPLEPGNVPTRLLLQSAADGSGGAVPASPYAALAEKYRQLAEDDPDNVQAHAFCAVAAQKRAVSNDADFAAYVAVMKQVLGSILVDSGASPCTDVVPQEMW